MRDLELENERERERQTTKYIRETIPPAISPSHLPIRASPAKPKSNRFINIAREIIGTIEGDKNKKDIENK